MIEFNYCIYAKSLMWQKFHGVISILQVLKSELFELINEVLIQFICILESQVIECLMGSFYTQRF